MAPLAGWLHERAIGAPGTPREFVTQRVDFAPHFSNARAARAATGALESLLTEESWRGVWQIEQAGAYRLLLEALTGSARLVVDGAEVASSGNEAIQESLVAELTLEAGPHPIEIYQAYQFEPVTAGARLSVFCCGDALEQIQPDVRPY
jgi:hypothetical protein